MKFLYRLNIFAILLAAFVVILGAYTRLTDAGLGCPDWPGCYGFLTVPTHHEDIKVATEAFPERPVEISKAWNEMIHRYLAGALGLVIAAMFFITLKVKQSRVLASVLLVTVCFQAVLGMWTVTMNLMPLVVMGHLLGGFTTFCLLVVMALSTRRHLSLSNIQSSPSLNCHKYYQVAKIALLVLMLQIALGGWTAANYAAVACTELPICEGQWQSRLDFEQAFSIPDDVTTYEYGALPYEARMTIHILHRIGAVFVFGVMVWLCVILLQSRSTRLKNISLLLAGLVTTQFALGVANVVFQLPLLVAVAHNFIALCLLASLISLLYMMRHQNIQQSSFNTWVKE
ncbi:MAG: COX15/CtaA family protein [Gammaproteobacteria bacterium]|nr:COX15/CtaA family protein [Gammaproteobacteria bacterium]